MSTATLLDNSQRSTEEESGLFHAAHTPCQRGNPFVTLACGRVADWEEERITSDLTSCPLCWNAHKCPVCGTELEPLRGA